MKTRRPRLSLPFTVVAKRDTIRLVAGEDFRYTLRAPQLEQWLPAFLERLDGRRSLDALLGDLDGSMRDTARDLVDRLYGERVLVDGRPGDSHLPARARLVVEGSGCLADRLRRAASAVTTREGILLRVLCQDSLDYDRTLRFGRSCLEDADAALWVTCGPMQRGFVSPVFRPDVGPCLGCLVRTFQRLSPAADLYDDLIEHARDGRAVAPASFPAGAREMLVELAMLKSEAFVLDDPPVSLYRLHVLELESLEISSHRVFADPECPDCAAVDGSCRES